LIIFCAFDDGAFEAPLSGVSFYTDLDCYRSCDSSDIPTPSLHLYACG
jgi:hypothetical protein